MMTITDVRAGREHRPRGEVERLYRAQLARWMHDHPEDARALYERERFVARSRCRSAGRTVRTCPECGWSGYTVTGRCRLCGGPVR